MDRFFFVISLFFVIPSTSGYAQENNIKAKKNISNNEVIAALITTLDKNYILSDNAGEMIKMLNMQLGKAHTPLCEIRS